MKSSDPLITRVGHAGWNDHGHFGYSVFNELAGNITTTGLIALAATGRRLDERSCAILDDIAVILTVADPRIYPLKLVRVASSYGDQLAGLATAIASMQGAIVGPMIAGNAASWLSSVKTILEDTVHSDRDLSELLEREFCRRGRIAGFGVPFRDVDERAVALNSRAEAGGFHTGDYWQLYRRIDRLVLEKRGLTCNVGLPIAALSLDMGLAPENLAALYTGLTMNVFLANAVEGAQQAPEILRSLPVDRVEYTGRPAREFTGLQAN